MFSCKILTHLVGLLIVVAILTNPRMGRAEYRFESVPGLSATGEYRMETILGEDPNDVISQRNELKLQFDYEKLAGGGGGPRVDFHTELRPFYDTVYDMGTGGMSENRELRKRWRTNYDWSGDKRDPLLREFYFDITGNEFSARLGRQIVAWGKSDGIYMLDVIHPFNYRNPFKFEEEDTKIPLWMANLSQRIGANGTLQLLWSPSYERAQYPGFRPEETVGGLDVVSRGGATGDEPLRHAFSFKVIDFTNEFYQLEAAIQPNGLFPVRVNKPKSLLKDGTVGLRWSDVIGDLNYTLNYLYTWSTFMGDFADTGSFVDGTATSVIRKPERMHVAGGSWDYPLNWLPGPFKGLVWRGETAFFVNDLFVNADETSPEFFMPDKVTHHGMMMGFDNNYNFDLLPWVPRAYLDPTWFISVQYWQDWILDSIRSKDAYYDFGGGTPNWATDFVGKGRRGDFKSQLTLFILKDVLPGDVLHTEWFVLYGIQSQDAWLRARIRYEVTDNLNVAIGVNKFLGGPFDPVGQFQNSDHVFLELRFVLF